MITDKVLKTALEYLIKYHKQRVRELSASNPLPRDIQDMCQKDIDKLSECIETIKTQIPFND